MEKPTPRDREPVTEEEIALRIAVDALFMRLDMIKKEGKNEHERTTEG